jgi:hypothetical protein
MATTNVNLATLENQFTNACYTDAAVYRQLGYDPHEFLRMLGEHGPRETARRLVPDGTLNHLPYGFTRLWQLGRLDLTLEPSSTTTHSSTRYSIRPPSQTAMHGLFSLGI